MRNSPEQQLAHLRAFTVAASEPRFFRFVQEYGTQRSEPLTSDEEHASSLGSSACDTGRASLGL